MAVYQNGVRLNEAFGDTVNWDAIPQTAIARMDVWSNNPVFGLNALGGAINLVMKNGFTWQGRKPRVQGGSYGHGMGTRAIWHGGRRFQLLCRGRRRHRWRLAAAFRFQSGPALCRCRLALGRQRNSSRRFGLAIRPGRGRPHADRADRQQNSAAVYTYPQTTQNRIGSLAVNGKTKLDDHWQLEASVYVRSLRQRHVDGNDGDFESCSTRSSFGGDLCLQDDAFGTPAGGKTVAFRNQFVIMNAAGPGVSLQASRHLRHGRPHLHRQHHPGRHGAVDRQRAAVRAWPIISPPAAASTTAPSAFSPTARWGAIFPNLDVAVDPTLAGSGNIIHTLGNLGYAPANLGGTTDYYGLYAVDALDLTDALTVTAGFRINAADIATRDRSGLAAELTGSHGYTHFNPLAGLTYKISDGLHFFGGYSEANRAPTPLELDCASQTQPCLLEGSLVADPPLKQVVAHTGEAGLRGDLGAGWRQAVNWSASLFRTDSNNDIVALASAIQGRGYYTNVPLTRRQGVDLTAHYQGRGWSTYVSYSYLDATYQFTGTLASPNNPIRRRQRQCAGDAGPPYPVSIPPTSSAPAAMSTIMPGLTVAATWSSPAASISTATMPTRTPSCRLWAVNLRAAYDIDAALAGVRRGRQSVQPP